MLCDLLGVGGGLLGGIGEKGGRREKGGGVVDKVLGRGLGRMEGVVILEAGSVELSRLCCVPG